MNFRRDCRKFTENIWLQLIIEPCNQDMHSVLATNNLYYYNYQA